MLFVAPPLVLKVETGGDPTIEGAELLLMLIGFVTIVVVVIGAVIPLVLCCCSFVVGIGWTGANKEFDPNNPKVGESVDGGVVGVLLFVFVKFGVVFVLRLVEEIPLEMLAFGVSFPLTRLFEFVVVATSNDFNEKCSFFGAYFLGSDLLFQKIIK